MTRLVGLVLGLCVISCTSTTESPRGGASNLDDASVGPPALEEVDVVRVEDGDSLILRRAAGTERARLQGINAPEVDECLGEEASASLAALVGERAAIALGDPERDQYGRLVVDVFAAERYVNEVQVEQGLAIAMSTDHRLRESLEAAQVRAATERLGMWSPDSCGGGPIASLEIVEIRANPPGPDDEVLDEETVTIQNVGSEAVELVGYVLRDESTVNRFVFGDQTLNPGDTITVVSGCDAPAGSLAWCADVPVWNNGGDTALLLDPRGRMVSRLGT